MKDHDYWSRGHNDDWQDSVNFPKHFKPLPEGYRIIQLNSGHYMWVWGDRAAVAQNDYSKEGYISVDRYWVRRCVFAHYEENKKAERLRNQATPPAFGATS